MKKFLILIILILGCSGINQNIDVSPTAPIDFKSTRYIAHFMEDSGNCGSIADQIVDFNINNSFDTKNCEVIRIVENSMVETDCNFVVYGCKTHSATLTYMSFDNKPGNSIMELDIECKTKSCASLYFISYKSF